MRTALLTLAILLGLASASPAATSAPSNLVLGAYSGSGALLTWDDDPTAQQWFIYVNAIQTFNPTRAYVQTSGTARLGYQLTGIPLSQLPVVISMKALGGSSLSAFSAGVTLTASSPIQATYVINPPGVPLLVSGTVGGGGGGAVTQGGPWTVSGSVAVTNLNSVTITSMPAVTFGGSYLGVSLKAQDTPITVSGSVAVSSLPGAYLGVSVVSQVDSPAYKGVSVVSGVNLGSVTITSMPAVTQGGPWTVSGSVGVSSFPGAYLGVSVVSQVDAASYKGVSIVSGLGSVTITSSPSAPLYVSPAVAGLFDAVTLTAISAPLSMTVTSGSALKTAVFADYDINTKTAYTRRGDETTTYWFNTTGTQTITGSGYNMLYSLVIQPTTTVGSVVTLFDGATTRVAVSGDNAHHYQWPRGVAFKSGVMTISITGTAYTGSVSLETDR